MAIERQMVCKTQKELEEMGVSDNATNIRKNNWFNKYEKRPDELEEVNLAQFVTNYTHNSHDIYTPIK